jgi:hypothetical protein
MSDAWFIFSEAQPQLFLDIPGASKSQGAKLIIWSQNHQPNQQFHIDLSSGLITSVNSGLVLDAEGGLRQGAHIIQWPRHSDPNQQWSYCEKDHTIKSRSGDFVFDIEEGNFTPGANVIVAASNNSLTQKWRIVNVANPTIFFGGQSSVFIIQVSGNPGLVLDVEGASLTDGGRLIIHPPNGGANQRFEFKNNAIFAAHSSKALDSEGGLSPGRRIIQWQHHGGANQQWVYDPASKAIRSASQNLVFDVKGANLRPRGEIMAWHPHNGPNQRWDLVPVILPVGDIFRIEIAGNHGLVLDISGGSTVEAAKVIIASPSGGLSQQFFFRGTEIVCFNSRKVLDCEGGLKHGANIIQYTAHGGPNQQWIYEPQSQEIRSTTRNLVLDVKGANLRPGSDVCAWPPNNGPNQKWRLVPV